MGAMFTGGGRSGRHLVRATAIEVRQRVSSYLPQILLAVIGAVLAWAIAGGLVHDHSPFFAPIAAVIALNASGGERGANAVRLLTGVFIGILAGEFSQAVAVQNDLAMALGVLLAMTVAAAFNTERVVIGQAAASAILTTIFIGGGSPGIDRLVDALIGAGVALLLSQMLFPARLVAMLRRIEEDALGEMAHMLDEVGRSLTVEGHDASAQVVNRLGDLSRPMAELSKARESSLSTIRLSTIRWGDPGPVLDEDEVIERLILLGESCLFLARTTVAMGTEERRELAPIVRGMADVLAILADDLSSREAREQAVEQALTAARGYGAGVPDDDPVTHATHLAVEMVATDIMLFAGIRFEEVEDVLMGELEDPTIPAPAQEPWLPWLRWRPRPPDIRFGRFRGRD
ncbi:aromatic acid exporter family protein [Nocardiopsis sp. MG754419]|uniref:FUSC family protein n=1 Tax=Nocardiopsis sp. MG754419 TaxID=2259865 RepID=UPI001BA93427|nr:FUSC family protein [Nocardiopsis sp. MG754419]MBR8743212.1 FUSC family protein [Nocardiopsis sp. MG754419]